MEGHQKLFYLPYPHTDFTYAVIGEELGLVGVMAVAGATDPEDLAARGKRAEQSLHEVRRNEAVRVAKTTASVAMGAGDDVVFLDVEMPGLTGVQAAPLIRERRNPPAVVFVTAHERYAVDAFAIDGLVNGIAALTRGIGGRAISLVIALERRAL